jgi:FixJ family two-component response regulator
MLVIFMLYEQQNKINEICYDDFLQKPFKNNDVFDLMHKHIQVKYIYENEDQSENEDNIMSKDEMKKALFNLDKQLIDEFDIAINVLDTIKTKNAIDKIYLQNKNLADSLKSLENNFEYDKLQELMIATTQSN